MSSCRILSYPSLEQLPTQQPVEGKFIQFHWQGNDYLLFAIKEQHRFHNQILAHFLSDNDIPHKWLDDQTLEIDTDRFNVMGGGRFLYDAQQNLLELWDNSQAYGRFNETGIEARIHSSNHPWSSAMVRIR